LNLFIDLLLVGFFIQLARSFTLFQNLNIIILFDTYLFFQQQFVIILELPFIYYKIMYNNQVMIEAQYGLVEE